MIGSPAMFTVTVKISLRYISTESAEPFRKSNAAEAFAGVRIASCPRQRASRNRLIKVLIFCAALE